MKGKKIASVALAGLLGVSLASCGSKGKWVATENFEQDATLSVDQVDRYESFVEKSNEERTKMLAALEDYAVRNHIAGLTLYEDGGFTKVNTRVQIPTKLTGEKVGVNEIHEYVTGYGFGIIQEGKLTRELKGVQQYKDYYHTFEGDDPGHLNYMNDKGSVIAGLQPYVASSYFDQRLSYKKTGFDSYEWYPSLATDENKVDGVARPIPLDENGNELRNDLQKRAKKYRIYVDTTVKYGTLGKYKAEYNGKKVELEDYVTPYKHMWMKQNGVARGAEALTGSKALVGAKEYYQATGEGFNQAAWDKVGLKTGTLNGKDYLEFEFITPCTPFYAMYYLNSTMVAPIPESFVQKVGGIKNVASFTDDSSVVDNTLSTGAYVVEKWEKEKEIVFKKNTEASTRVLGGEHRYQIPGIHVAILKGIDTDPELAYKEYEQDKLDQCGIPKTKLDAVKDKEGTQKSKGSSTTKLNMNTCNEQEWEYLFGENGVVTQTQKSDYYKVKPIMNNDDFLDGFSYAINREEYAKQRGATPSCEYFADAYIADPDKNLAYNETKEHQDVMASIYGDSVKTYGYDLQKAIDKFDKAAETLLAEGKYKKGDKIEITIWWQAQAQIKQNGAQISKYVVDAWNMKAAKRGLTLEVKNEAVTLWSDVYFKKMMVGQFDIAFGGINGNQLNPLNFIEVLKSDNSSGFTLNWGPNTNDPEAAKVTYDNVDYTFDALFQVADTGAVLTNKNSLAKLADAALVKNVLNADGSRTVQIKYQTSSKEGVCKTAVQGVNFFWLEDESAKDNTSQHEVKFTNENGLITINFTKEQVEKFKGQLALELNIANDKGYAKSFSFEFAFSYWSK